MNDVIRSIFREIFTYNNIIGNGVDPAKALPVDKTKQAYVYLGKEIINKVRYGSREPDDIIMSNFTRLSQTEQQRVAYEATRDLLSVYNNSSKHQPDEYYPLIEVLEDLLPRFVFSNKSPEKE